MHSPFRLTVFFAATIVVIALSRSMALQCNTSSTSYANLVLQQLVEMAKIEDPKCEIDVNAGEYILLHAIGNIITQRTLYIVHCTSHIAVRNNRHPRLNAKFTNTSIKCQLLPKNKPNLALKLF